MEWVDVEVSAGRVRGSQRNGAATFLGVPFAAAPVGDLRFRGPVPAIGWSGIRDATHFGPTPLRREIAQATTIPEECVPGLATLNVNVFTPAPGDLGARLPVLAWIHGGGYTGGSPASAWYDGRAFNRSGIVTVTVSYRLGFDGFGWIDGAPPNRGLMDQVAALRWIRENIEQFGGDPHRVTLAGQSAGGGSVLALLSTPSAEGLFSSAIVQSGAPSRMSEESAKEITRRMGSVAQISATDVAAWSAVSEEAILRAQLEVTSVVTACTLSGLDAESLVVRLANPLLDHLRLPFGPVVDNESLLDFEAAQFRGLHRGIPLLIGSTHNELAAPYEEGLDALIPGALERRGMSAAAVRAFGREAQRLGPGASYRQLMAHGVIRLATVHIADTRRASGAASRTWLYDFRHFTQESPIAAHCHELPFVWDCLDAPGVREALGSRPSQWMADVMHSDWARFIRSGHCGWPSVDGAGDGARTYARTHRYRRDAYQLELELLRSCDSRNHQLDSNSEQEDRRNVK